MAGERLCKFNFNFNILDSTGNVTLISDTPIDTSFSFLRLTEQQNKGIVGVVHYPTPPIDNPKRNVTIAVWLRPNGAISTNTTVLYLDSLKGVSNGMTVDFISYRFRRTAATLVVEKFYIGAWEEIAVLGFDYTDPAFFSFNLVSLVVQDGADGVNELVYFNDTLVGQSASTYAFEETLDCGFNIGGVGTDSPDCMVDIEQFEVFYHALSQAEINDVYLAGFDAAKAADPVFNPAGGVVPAGSTITLSSPEGFNIKWLWDAEADNAQLYTTPIPARQGTLYAYCTDPNMQFEDSNTVSKSYLINFVGGIRKMLILGRNTIIGWKPTADTEFTVAAAGVTAPSIAAGNLCKIVSVGNTNFKAIGADSNDVGVIFRASGAGVGSGTVDTLTEDSAVYTRPFITSFGLDLTMENLKSEAFLGNRYDDSSVNTVRKVEGSMTVEASLTSLTDMVNYLAANEQQAVDTLDFNKLFITGYTAGTTDVASYSLHRYKECAIDSFTLNIAKKAFITMEVGLVGKDVTVINTTVAGTEFDDSKAAFAALDAGPRLTSFSATDITFVRGATSIPLVGFLNSLKLTINNNIDKDNYQINQKTLRTPQFMSSTATVTMECEFDADTYSNMVADLKNDASAMKVEITLNDGTAEKTLTIYEVKPTDVKGPWSTKDKITLNITADVLWDTSVSKLIDLV